MTDLLQISKDSTIGECEDVIRHGLHTFIQVGQALMLIRDARLYHEKGYERFEDYCQEVWGWSRVHVHRQIEAAKVACLLPIGNTPIPATESQARELAPLMRQDETEMVDTWHELQAQYGDKVTAAKIKDVVQRKLKQEVARTHIPEPAITPAIPIGKYKCIVIDPPWPMVKIEREERPNQGVTLDYPVMSLEEIAALPIPEMAEQSGCHIYLWVTQKYLPDGLRIFEAWGVKYQCVMTWVKNVGFTPFSWMYSTEHVLFGRIGSLDLLRLGMRLDFNAKVNGHSVKPDVFYTTVIDASPEPRLEMFARQRRDGFTPWGNEI